MLMPVVAPSTPEVMTLQQLRLLQLASPALPVGGFSYSQGLEAASFAGLVTGIADTRAWIEALLTRILARLDAPVFLLSYQAFAEASGEGLEALNQFYIASRDTQAARDETRQMGWSLAQLAQSLDWFDREQAAQIARLARPAYPLVFASCAQALEVPSDAALSAYLFAWLEGQCISAQKLLPIGQNGAQGILFDLARQIPAVGLAASARARIGLTALETLAPHWSILAARHESQYSKMFRS